MQGKPIKFKTDKPAVSDEKRKELKKAVELSRKQTLRDARVDIQVMKIEFNF